MPSRKNKNARDSYRTGIQKRRKFMFKKGDPRFPEFQEKLRKKREEWKRQLENDPELQESLKVKPAKWERNIVDTSNDNATSGTFVRKQLRLNPKKNEVFTFPAHKQRPVISEEKLKKWQEGLEDEINFDDIYEDDPDDGQDEKEVLDVQSSIWPGRALERLYELHQQGKMCDVFIQGSDGLMLVANSQVLKAASPVLNKKLSEDPRMIHMDNITSVTWEHLLRFIYTGEMMAPPEERGPLLEAAQYLEMEGLVTKEDNNIVDQQQVKEVDPLGDQHFADEDDNFDMEQTENKQEEDLENNPTWQPVVKLRRAEDILWSLSAAHSVSASVFVELSGNSTATTYTPPDIPSPCDSPEPLESTPHTTVPPTPAPSVMPTSHPSASYLQNVSTLPQMDLESPPQTTHPPAFKDQPNLTQSKSISLANQSLDPAENQKNIDSVKEKLRQKLKDKVGEQNVSVGATKKVADITSRIPTTETFTDVQVDPKMKKWLLDEEFSSANEEDVAMEGVVDENDLQTRFVNRFEKMIKENPTDFETIEPPEESEDDKEGEIWKCMVKVPKRQQILYAIQKSKLVATNVTKEELTVFGHAGGLAEAVLAVAELGKAKTQESLVNLKLGTPEEVAKLKALQPPFKARPHINMVTVPDSDMKHLIFKCIYCGKRFLTKTDALEHQNMKEMCKEDESEQELYQCSTCRKVFTFRLAYISHVQKSKCQVNLKDKLQLLEAKFMTIEKTITLPAYWCTNCNKLIFDQHRMMQHGYRKNKCNKYASGILLEKRKKRRDKEITCTSCHATFKTYYAHDKHLKKCEAIPDDCVDRDENFLPRLYLCCICDFTHVTKQEIQRHARKEHPEECEHFEGFYNEQGGFRCQVCHKIYQRGTSYNEHLWQKHGLKINRKGKYFKCSVCDFRTTFVRTMKSHLEGHEETRQKRYNCKRCGKTFGHKKVFQDHVNKYHMNYLCSYCGKGFSKPSLLGEHLPIHTGKNPFKCLLCAKAFPFVQTANNHIMKVHGVHKNEVKRNRVCIRYPENEVNAILRKTSTEQSVAKQSSGVKSVAESQEMQDDYQYGDSDAEDVALSTDINQVIEMISEEVVTDMDLNSQGSLLHQSEGSPEILEAEWLTRENYVDYDYNLEDQDVALGIEEVQSLNYGSVQEQNVELSTSQVQHVAYGSLQVPISSSQVQSAVHENSQVLNRSMQVQSVDENGLQVNVVGRAKELLQPVRMFVGDDGTPGFLEISPSTLAYLDSNRKDVATLD